MLTSPKGYPKDSTAPESHQHPCKTGLLGLLPGKSSPGTESYKKGFLYRRTAFPLCLPHHTLHAFLTEPCIPGILPKASPLLLNQGCTSVLLCVCSGGSYILSSAVNVFQSSLTFQSFIEKGGKNQLHSNNMCVCPQRENRAFITFFSALSSGTEL